MNINPYVRPETDVIVISVESVVLYGGGGTTDLPKDPPGEWES